MRHPRPLTERIAMECSLLDVSDSLTHHGPVQEWPVSCAVWFCVSYGIKELSSLIQEGQVARPLGWKQYLVFALPLMTQVHNVPQHITFACKPRQAHMYGETSSASMSMSLMHHGGGPVIAHATGDWKLHMLTSSPVLYLRLPSV